MQYFEDLSCVNENRVKKPNRNDYSFKTPRLTYNQCREVGPKPIEMTSELDEGIAGNRLGSNVEILPRVQAEIH